MLNEKYKIITTIWSEHNPQIIFRKANASILNLTNLIHPTLYKEPSLSHILLFFYSILYSSFSFLAKMTPDAIRNIVGIIGMIAFIFFYYKL